MYGENQFGSVQFGGVGGNYAAHTKDLTDTVTTTDLIFKSGAKILSDVSTVTDKIIKSISRSIGDSFSGLVDIDIDTVKSRGWELIDSIGLSELFSKSTSRNLSETANTSDNIGFIRSLHTLLSDAFSGLVDSIETVYQRNIFSNDTINLSDTTSKLSTRNIADDLSVSDVLSKIKGQFISFVDSLSMSDVFLRIRGKFFSDSIRLYEYIQKILNGILVSKWVKSLKATASYLFSGKAVSSIFTKSEKPTSIWTKMDKPE